MTLIIFILTLVALIVVHEAGHFFAAKLFGIRVDEFAVGFPPRVYRVRRGETDYTFNLILLGGFVRIHGERLSEGGGDPRSLASRSRLVQAAVIVAGIAMNLAAAWLLISAAYMIGIPTVVDGAVAPGGAATELTIIAVLPGSPAARAGIEGGDVIESIETGTAKLPMPASPSEARAFIGGHGDESIGLTVLRGGQKKLFLARPAAGLIPDDASHKALGVEFAYVATERYAPLAALGEGAKLAAEETSLTAQGLWTFFSNLALGRANLADVSGPVGIARAGAAAAADGAGTLLLFAAFISINLALINIIPIPGLDGGRLLVLAVEGVRRKPISETLNTYLTAFGFILLIALMVAVTYHDIARLL